MTGPTDEELWLRAASDPSAFGTLFERHADSVYNHCFRRCGSWSAAEDLSSAVFLEAWRRRRDVRLAGDSILPWLLAVANNVSRHQERTLRRHRRLLAKLPTAVLEPDPADELVERLDDERRMQSILRVFGELKRHEQDVLALCAWGSLDYAAAAVALNVPVGTVRSRLSRARAHLNDLLTAAGPVDPGATGLPPTRRSPLPGRSS